MNYKGHKITKEIVTGERGGNVIRWRIEKEGYNQVRPKLREAKEVVDDNLKTKQ